MGRVSAMTRVRGGRGPRLELPDEPEDLKIGLRDALLDGQDWRDGFSDDICIGLWLWGRWQSGPRAGRVSREEFVDVVIANRRELWLWLIGDRQWLQFLTGLAGRIVRRLPVRPMPAPERANVQAGRHRRHRGPRAVRTAPARDARDDEGGPCHG